MKIITLYPCLIRTHDKIRTKWTVKIQINLSFWSEHDNRNQENIGSKTRSSRRKRHCTSLPLSSSPHPLTNSTNMFTLLEISPHLHIFLTSPRYSSYLATRDASHIHLSFIPFAIKVHLLDAIGSDIEHTDANFIVAHQEAGTCHSGSGWDGLGGDSFECSVVPASISFSFLVPAFLSEVILHVLEVDTVES